MLRPPCVRVRLAGQRRSETRWREIAVAGCTLPLASPNDVLPWWLPPPAMGMPTLPSTRLVYPPPHTHTPVPVAPSKLASPRLACSLPAGWPASEANHGARLLAPSRCVSCYTLPLSRPTLFLFALAFHCVWPPRPLATSNPAHLTCAERYISLVRPPLPPSRPVSSRNALLLPLSLSLSYAMRLGGFLALLGAALGLVHAAHLPSHPLHSHLAARDGSQGPLSWDSDSIKVANTPFWLFSAEFHPFRLPVRNLWRDPLQKLKASGFNAVSIYTHWGAMQSRPEGESLTYASPANDLARFLENAREVGIFVILRPGPYINAEANGGGFPGWVSNLDTQTRINTTAFKQAWQPYISSIIKTAAPFQAKLGADGKLDLSGGTLIAVQVENEFRLTAPAEAYFNQLIDVYRQNGLTVPTTFNALGGRTDFAANDHVDLWGADSYPQGFNCSNPQKWANLGRNYTHLTDQRPSNPRFVPEFQGGSFDPYNGAGYEACAQLLNEQFVRVYDKHLLAQGVKLLSHYMGFGGTNYGNFAYSGAVYSSYDYGAAVDESRIKRPKAGEYNLIGQFLQSFPEFASSTATANGTNLFATLPANGGWVHVTQLEAKAIKGAGRWYAVRQNDVRTTTNAQFTLQVPVGGKSLTIPRKGSIQLLGRDSIILPVDKALEASGATLSYSTSDVSFVGKVGARDVVVAYADAGKQSELQLAPPAGKALEPPTSLPTGVSAQALSTGELVVSWTAGDAPAFVTLNVGSGGSASVLLVLAPTRYAYQSRSLALAAPGTLESVIGTGARAWIGGNAYQISNGTVVGDTLQLWGQLNDTTTLQILAPDSVTKVAFNGGVLDGVQRTAQGVLEANAGGPANGPKRWTPPALGGWKVADSLPEVGASYVPSGSDWVNATLTSTPNSWFLEATTGGKVLFNTAYGFYSGGNLLWRGTFNVAAGKVPTAVEVGVQGGSWFAASVYLNGKHLGALEGSGTVKRTNATFAIPADTVKVGGANVVTIIQDDTGMEEFGSVTSTSRGNLPKEGVKSPRGLFHFNLVNGPSADTVAWQLAGNRGGAQYPDQVRGIYNEGGLYGERQGWHLPGFDDSQWAPATTPLGFDGPGVKFYRTTVGINFAAGYDIPLSIVFDEAAKQPDADWRALVFVNGWQFGRRLAKWGPQTSFPIPPGVLVNKGDNVVVLAVWSPSKGARLPEIRLEKRGVFLGVPTYETNNPTWDKLRK
ncbi:hypothetical protein ACQY0O_001505 [Thecaphora frezii]